VGEGEFTGRVEAPHFFVSPTIDDGKGLGVM